ncbi:MAG TPA: zf-HC2 domain-containing protein [Acidobacteriota bacterium]|jgi:hypothetical protein|nr:zf-HC2 domain-containing protein [Acidobacteriota bacterium]
MNNCERFEDQFVDALYNELNPQSQIDFNLHLKECPECSASYQKMQKTLNVMDERVQREPSPEYWTKYDESLKDRLAKAKTKEKGTVIWFQKIPGWALKAAAAFILIAVGIVIGRYYMAPAAGPIAKQTPTEVPVQRASLDPETKRFLERSEILLVGIVNLEPDEDSTYSTDLTAQKKMSRELIQQAPIIRANLKGPERRRLTQLVSDLELILLQIANLESENDVPEIELVKSGVDRKGVLFKINVEQMRMSGAAEKSPDQQKASGDQKL